MPCGTCFISGGFGLPVRRLDRHVQLADRLREVVGLLCEGDSSKHIARKLDLSVGTVRKHRENIMAKLDVHSVAELIALALKRR